MKVAVCLSGLTRSFSWCWPLIERYLVRPYDADVYLHTWDEDHGGARCSPGNQYEHGLAPSFPDGRTKSQFIDEEVSPAAYEIENFSEWSKEVNFHHNAQAMYYGIWIAFELKNNSNIKYDLSIRARMDFFFDSWMHRLRDIQHKIFFFHFLVPQEASYSIQDIPHKIYAY